MFSVDQLLVGATNLTGSYLGQVTGIAPTSGSLTVPVATPIYGNGSVIMGKPSGWLIANLSGTTIRVPYWN